MDVRIAAVQSSSADMSDGAMIAVSIYQVRGAIYDVVEQADRHGSCCLLSRTKSWRSQSSTKMHSPSMVVTNKNKHQPTS
jgi:hypothetical protein